MLYAVLCYNSEEMVTGWTQAEDDAVMDRLAGVHERLYAKKQLGPAIRLMPTTTATTLRKGPEPHVVLDGPYAETKEQLLGFYILDCPTLEEAIQAARDLGVANPTGAYEIRPLRLYQPGVPIAETP
jgi:hypothetical protein